MTEAYRKLLVDFETRVRHLILLCDKLKAENEQLKQELLDKKNKIKLKEDTIQQVTEQYNRLQLGGYLSTGESDVRQAKQRINKLVRDIDKCIALLDE